MNHVFHSPKPLQFIVMIDFPLALQEYAGVINDSIKSKMAGRLKLFDNASCEVIAYDRRLADWQFISKYSTT